MMDEQALTELARAIMRQGYDEDTASRYAVLIGDLPIRDAAGRLVVMDGERVVARLEWIPMFG